MTEYEALKLAKQIMDRRRLIVWDKSVNPVDNARTIKITKNNKTISLNIPLQWGNTSVTTKFR
jgi:RecA/RadA recombinase